MYSRGTAINYTPAMGMAPFLGAKTATYASVTLRPSARLDFEQMFTRERLDTMPHAPAPRPQMIFNTNLLRSKASVQLTKSLAVRAILDYSQFNSDASLFSEAGSERLMHEVLVRYVLHPGTAVFVGFNKRSETAFVDPRADSWLPPSPGGQQVFVKMSYLFRF